MSDIADRFIKTRLAMIPGVSATYLDGERRYAMRIWLDPDRLAARRLTVEDVEEAIRNQNASIPAGRIEAIDAIGDSLKGTLPVATDNSNRSSWLTAKAIRFVSKMWRVWNWARRIPASWCDSTASPHWGFPCLPASLSQYLGRGACRQRATAVHLGGTAGRYEPDHGVGQRDPD